MSFLDKTGLQTLTNKLVQGDAIKVASHRGHTVKNVIDNIQRECDNVANPLEYKMENRVADFKIGKGRDVDVSGDVENGYTEVELQGKTYQNLCPKHFIDYTSKSDYDGWKYIENGKYLIKPNTQYTIIVNVKSFKHLEKKGSYLLNNAQASNCIFNTKLWIGSEGIKRFLVTSQSDLTNKTILLRCQNQDSRAIIKITDFIILEGDHTKTPIEELPQYFEGIKSSFEDGIVDVEVQGKNLFSNLLSHSSCLTNIDVDTINLDNSSFATKPLNGYDIFCFANIHNYSDLAHSLEDIEPNQYYTISFELRKKGAGNINYISIFGFKDIGAKYQIVAQFGNFYGVGEEYKKFSKTIKSNYFKDLKYFTFVSQVTEEASGTVFEFKNVQIEKLRNQSQFEPYYKKKISFNIGEPLRSLPNGVCDEIRNSNGQWELVRRVGKTILNGKEEWQFYIENTNTIRCLYTISAMKMTDKYLANMICDLFKVVPNSEWENDTEQIEQGWTRSEIGLRINKTKLSSQDVAGFKQWLSKNPTTVYYELTTPAISPIEPIEFDVKPLATMTINSEIAPISNHKVVLNRAGQIEQGIVQIAELKKRVDVLETAYDSYLLETQHKLSILGFEYELESEEI